MNKPAQIVERIANSDVYKEYERAFNQATHLPLNLRPVETWRLGLEGKKYENPFCAMLAKCNRTCAACLETQKRMDEIRGGGPKTVTCFAGLTDSAIPVEAGAKPIGFLQTGQVALRKPTISQFAKIAERLQEWNVTVDLAKLEEAYYRSRQMPVQQYAGILKLLETFSKHLSLIANEVMVQEEEIESPLIRRARAYIHANQGDPIDLAKVAQAMHVSVFYFCKLFKKATGLTFTEYLGRVRVEKAKQLLLNPHLRISEIAYDVGFQSLTHFNRVFRQVTGKSPSAYREAKSVHQMLN
jgi:AraC-like DNA-binding protein/ligand-binding sensor protein